MIKLSVDDLVDETPEAEPFWRGLANGQLSVQSCAECGRRRFPPIASCPYCSAAVATWVQIEPAGTLYSWVVTHVAFDPSLAADVPYTVATVELDGGGRMFARLTGCEPGELQAGLPVEGYFHEESGLPYLRFRPRSANTDGVR